MSRQKTIVFVNQSAGYLMVDIIHAHLEHYDKAILLTGLLNPRNRPLDSSVKVHRLATYKRTSTLQRLFTWGLAFIKSWFLIRFKYPKAHLYLVSNPPIAPLLPKWLSNTFTLLIYDVYPDALVAHGVFNDKSFIVKWWQRQNQKIYNQATQLFTLSEGMKELLTKYVSREHISVVPVWTDNDFLQPLTKAQNPFIKEQGLENRFIILYSGNLGKSHELSVLVKLAERLQDTNAFFLIIGEGDQYLSLKDQIEKSGLENIRLLPWQPTKKLPFTMASADVGVVSLGSAASKMSVPSKLYNLLSVGAAILGIAEQEAELAKLIAQYEVGASFRSRDVDGMALYLSALLDKPEKQAALATNALRASEDFTPEKAKFMVN